MDKKICVHSINVSDPLEEESNFFDIDLVHFGLSVPLVRCLYSCTLPVFGKTTAFIFPV